MVAELHGLLASRDGKRWREITHTIKGAARGVGAFGMGEAAARPNRSIPPTAPRPRPRSRSWKAKPRPCRPLSQTYLAA